MPKEPSFHRQSLRPNTIRSLYTSSRSSNRNARQTLHGNTTLTLELASGPSIDEDIPILTDDGGIDFDVPGDGDSRSQGPIEEDVEPEEPVPGVRCVPKPKAKRYENSVSRANLNSILCY